MARLILLLCLLVSESFYVSLRFDAWTLIDGDGTTWFKWLGLSGHVVKIAIVFLVAFLLALGPRVRVWLDELVRVSTDHKYHWLLLAQVLVYGLFFLLTARIFSQDAESGSLSTLIPAFWMLFVPILIGLWFVAVAPTKYWLKLLRSERTAWTVALFVALAAWGIAISSQQLWGFLAELTFTASSAVLSLTYSEVIVYADSLLLGTPEFRVIINSACSGYEGIGLVVVLLTFYLSMFRKDFRFPQALLLFPVGIITIWTFNVLRIVLLIVIGTEWSRDIALGGFHSQAGWISFIVVSVAMLILAHRIPAFRAEPRKNRVSLLANQNVALLLPLVVLLSVTLLTTAFSSGFDLTYPVRVIATGVAIVLLRRHYALAEFRVSPVAVAAGTGVFLAWIYLVPESTGDDLAVATQMEAMAGGVLVVWTVFRVIGSVITVPIAEELAFRGYFLGRLSNANSLVGGQLKFSWTALILSSVFFGLLHSAFIAGSIAGLVYGLVRYHCGRIVDAVVAHATTNLLLSAYVLTTGKWSLW